MKVSRRLSTAREMRPGDALSRWRRCPSPLERGIGEGENPVSGSGVCAPVRRAFVESRCLGVQRKEGGARLPRLNTRERPIVNKYREGKMQSTWKRE